MQHAAYRFPSAAHRAQVEAAGPLALDWIGASEETPDQHWCITAWAEAPPAALAAHARPPAEAPRWWAGVPLAPPPAPVIRPEDMPPLTPAQLELALLSVGKTAAMVEAAIAAIPDTAARQAGQVLWRRADRFERSHPLIGQLGAALGLTDAQINALWLAAAAGN